MCRQNLICPSLSFPMINTSIPPPRITLLQKPRQPQQPHSPSIRIATSTGNLVLSANGNTTSQSSNTTNTMIILKARASSPPVEVSNGGTNSNNHEETHESVVEKEPEIKYIQALEAENKKNS